MFARVGFGAAVRAVQRTLQAGLDPAQDFDRKVLDLASGQLLLMPAQWGDFVGVKVATIAPGNPTLGKERIHGVYLLMDVGTLGPVALLDRAALTTLRTATISAAVAVVSHLVVFGSGPQGWGHVCALRTVRSELRVTIIARDQHKAGEFASRVQTSGLDARVGTANDVQDAELIVCATTAAAPLFDGALVPDDTCVVAIGSHTPDRRELDSARSGARTARHGRGSRTRVRARCWARLLCNL